MIRATGLKKTFGKVVAVDGVSFHVEEGESVALWGRNGAGKTTVLRCLLGVIPFQGSASIGGFDVRRQGRNARGLVGFVPQDVRFHDNLSVVETMSLLAQIRRAAPNEAADLIERMGLGPFTDKRVRTLSGGVRQRLALAVSLLSEPPLLFLDEPTSNLDARSRRDYVSFLQEQRARGRTILFCSHRIDEVNALANRVIVLENGRAVTDAAPGALSELLGEPTTLIVYLDGASLTRAAEVLTESGFEVSRNGVGLKVPVRSNEKARPLNCLAKAGVPADDFRYETPADEETRDGI